MQGSSSMSIKSYQLSNIEGTYPTLINLVRSTQDLTTNPMTEKLATLGQKYLSLLVYHLANFNLSKHMNNVDITSLIDWKLFNGESANRLHVRLGKLYHDGNVREINKIEGELEKFIEENCGNEQSYSEIKHEDSVSNILNQSLVSNLEEIASFDLSNQTEEASGIIVDRQEHEKDIRHRKKVDNFLKGKNGTSELELLRNSKQKTFKVVEDPADIGPIKRYRVTLKFVDFLNDGQTKEEKSTAQGSNSKFIKEKANMEVLRKFFYAHPLMFKDYLHYIYMKGKAAGNGNDLL